MEEDLKRELLNAVRLVFEGDLLPRLGLPRRRGLLLCGPPGNGKTLCIRALLHEYPDASLLYLVRPEMGLGGWAFEQLLEDAALLQRPHRFDRVFVLRPPGEALRRRYLRERAQIPLEEEELEELVRRTEGLSFAYLQELIVSAHYAAAFAGEPLGFCHYREAARRIVEQRRQGEALERSGLLPKRRVGFFPAEEGEPDPFKEDSDG